MIKKFSLTLFIVTTSILLYGQEKIYTNSFYLWYNTYSNAKYTAESPLIEKDLSIIQVKIDEFSGTGTIVIKNQSRNTIVTHDINGKLKELYDKNTNSTARVYAGKLNAYGFSQLETVTLIYHANSNKLESIVLTSIEHQSKGNFIGLKPIEDELNSTGSGFIVSKNGYILTNYHVIENAKKIYVSVNNRNKIEANLINFDESNDIALLKVEREFQINYSLSKNIVEIGTSIFVLGYPMIDLLGGEVKVTDGIISSTSGFDDDYRYYQISAPIQPGNSGGPLYDNNGNLIGLITSKFTYGENVGYALKSSFIFSFLKNNNIDIPNDKKVFNTKSFTQKINILKSNVVTIESIRN